ncbi:thiopurine S-methyltransferase [Microbulbifer agarilyticus]|uniref:thiopurine S-methyltransferase n=1 Tax=Microbulbifer agarilyticus TaxID=260552 RepID=UPI001C966895|nr:thiopurine S-methyltransferase [Microbulbifer agarilyticus]MBY6210735.1 thiopurine S-methyltransferase [Microbulbifer agarilyticus]
MEHKFWLDKWHKNEIGFHNPDAHPLLVEYLDALELSAGARVFLPLCGKTLDIACLLQHGYRVVGAELSELAIQQLFAQLGAEPQVTKVGNAKLYSAGQLEVFVGDFFELTRDALGFIDAVYDRAALVALPETMRTAYAAHLIALTEGADQLLLAIDYDQSQLPGPPFCVDAAEVHRLYDSAYKTEQLGSAEIDGGLKGKVPAHEVVWLLR